MSSQIYPTPLYRPPLPFTAASHATPTRSTSPTFGSSSSSLSTLPMSQFNTPGQYVPYTSSAVPGTLSPMYTSPTNTPLSTPPIAASSPSVRSGLKRPHHLHHQVDSAPLKPIDETTDESDVDEDEDDDDQDDDRVGTLPRPNSMGVLHSFRSAPPSDAASSRSRHPKKKRRIVESFAGLSLDPTAASASRSAAGLAAAAQPAQPPTTVTWNESARVQGDGTPALPQTPITNFGQLPMTSLPTPDIEDLPMGTGPSSFDLDEHRIYVASLDSPPPSPNLSPLTHETETEAHTDLTNLTIPTTMLKHLPPPLPLDVIKSLEAADKGAERGAAQALVLYQPLKWTPQEREQQLEEFRREQAKQERYDDADGVDLDSVEGAEGNGMEID
ncbi:BZ3500_MvSof-1268-A1-R1_Chr1-1g01168 [Microbotryum saponariae]|uniref:BZ3500_MvSof-1268-A1-R1_Chr1-1g01168 protein n=1 Tax=Microbotryum saponariae TaxID=289078 RepID=A0A2X0KIV2_9BASI|nr:BZ3500_MvSof-1268-A1-R1_Chr1-1g01168 [Microbotryum saponariae]SCZ93562.1 BZ3501_MvSof-1269-A2-R1_Chr1-1g00764 [Microbotryum saponariae]